MVVADRQGFLSSCFRFPVKVHLLFLTFANSTSPIMKHREGSNANVCLVAPTLKNDHSKWRFGFLASPTWYVVVAYFVWRNMATPTESRDLVIAGSRSRVWHRATRRSFRHNGIVGNNCASWCSISGLFYHRRAYGAGSRLIRTFYGILNSEIFLLHADLILEDCDFSIRRRVSDGICHVRRFFVCSEWDPSCLRYGWPTNKSFLAGSLLLSRYWLTIKCCLSCLAGLLKSPSYWQEAP